VPLTWTGSGTVPAACDVTRSGDCRSALAAGASGVGGRMHGVAVLVVLLTDRRGTP
jgi:hypothetical protein